MHIMDVLYFVDMQSSIARYFCYHKIDMFFVSLKTRYDINLVAARQHIECVSAVRLEPNMVLKWKFRVIWQKSLRTYESIILEISLSYPKFLILKLADLKPWEIFKIFDAESAVRLSPCKDDKLKRLEFNRFKAYCVQVLLH